MTTPPTDAAIAREMERAKKLREILDTDPKYPLDYIAEELATVRAEGVAEERDKWQAKLRRPCSNCCGMMQFIHDDHCPERVAEEAGRAIRRHAEETGDGKL